MKDYKIICLVLFFWCGLMHSQTYTLVDKVVAGQKATINGSLVVEILSLKDQQKSYEELTKLEKQYDDKRDASGFAASSKVLIAVVLYSIESTENKIEDVLEEATVVLNTSLHIKQRIEGIIGDLAMEQKYIDEIEEDYKWLALGVEFGGGVGYTYTAFLKVLKRSMEIRRNVMLLDKEVKNLNTINKFFIKKS